MVYYPPNDTFFRVKKIVCVEYADYVNCLETTEHNTLSRQPNSVSQKKSETIRIKKTKVSR